MMMTKRQVILLDDSDENADWIKAVVGKDGLTAKQREQKIYEELKKEFEQDDGGDDETLDEIPVA